VEVGRELRGGVEGQEEDEEKGEVAGVQHGAAVNAESRAARQVGEGRRREALGRRMHSQRRHQRAAYCGDGPQYAWTGRERERERAHQMWHTHTHIYTHTDT
jgi:hypothetical protein